jgi:uncharacterized repeat protein (TIGR01451 family)
MIVSAVMPPANSSIGNKAAATYVDAAGQPQNVESNPVSTTVAQIGAVTLTSDQSKTVAPGQTAYASHTLTNTGNGSDTFKIKAEDIGTGFTSVAIYPDANGTGVPSSLTPLCATPAQGSAPLCSAGFDQLLAPNGPFRFIVAYRVPDTATAPTAPYDTAKVTVAPASSSASIPYPPTTVSGETTPGLVRNIDTVNTTKDAAFIATKALAAPSVQPPSGSWPTVLTTGKASPASCDTTAATTWSATLVSGHPECTYTVYTLSYTNNGGATGNFSINDVIGTGATAGLTYVTGSAVWSGAGGTALSESGGITGPVASNVKSTWDSVTKTFKATVTNVDATKSGTISFVVLVNKDATVVSGTITSTTTNIGKFWPTSCDPSASPSATNCGNNTTTPPSETNPSDFPIAVTYGVAATNASGLTTPDGTTTPPADTGINLVTAPTVAPGGSVSFTNWITNTGSATDSFKLSVQGQSGSSGTPAFPAGTTFAFYKADGFTPFVTANTGPVLAGASIAVVVRATIPPSTPTAGTTPFEALLTATSDNGTGVSDSVWDRVQDVIPPVVKVDMTNTATGDKFIDGTVAPVACTPGSNCDLGQGPSTNPTDIQYTTPGTGVTFPLFVKNMDTVDGTYNLTANVPSGWTVKFVAAGGTCATSTAITQVSVPGSTPPATPAQVEVEACVTPPANTAVGKTNVLFTATSSTDPAIHDTITDAVAVTAPVIKSLTLTPPTTNSTTSGGGTVIDPATLTNTGNQNCGGSTGFTVKTEFVEPGLVDAGWSAVVYFDRSPIAAIGSEDTQLAPGVAGVANLTPAIAKDPAGSGASMIPLVPGKSLPLLVKIFAPTGALNGGVANVKLTVTDVNSVTADQCPAQTSTITTTISNGQLRMDKTQALDAACDGTADTTYSAATIPVIPGQCIAYQVVAHNDGAANVTNVVISDAAPGYTTYQASPVAGTCAVVGGTGASPVFTVDTATQGVKCAPASGGVTLAPAGTMTMKFNVKVDK